MAVILSLSISNACLVIRRIDSNSTKNVISIILKPRSKWRKIEVIIKKVEKIQARLFLRNMLKERVTKNSPVRRVKVRAVCLKYSGIIPSNNRICGIICNDKEVSMFSKPAMSTVKDTI
jgi:hypothetical protein